MLLSSIPVSLLPYFHNKGADQTVCGTINLLFIIGKCLLFAKNRLNKDSAKAFCTSAFGKGLQGKIYEPNTTPP